MASVGTWVLGFARDLPPGQTAHWIWYNAPSGVVWMIFAEAFANPGTRAKVEVTRVWHESSMTNTYPTTATSEVHYVVQNVGSSTVNYQVKVATISS